MRIILGMMICLLACALAAVPPDSYAQSANPSISCSVSVRAYAAPAPLYDGGDRRNPDKSLYPGDATHYMFVYRGSDTCLRFKVNELNSYGAIGVIDHDVAKAVNVTGLEPDELRPELSPRTHSHSTFDVAVEWVEPDDDDERPHAEWSTPSASHNSHQDPVYEDDESVEAFKEFVKDRCTSDRLYAGCAWGHIEVDTDATGKVCLHEHMKSEGIRIPDGVPDECKNRNYITMSVEGDGKRCKKNDKGGWDCDRFTRTNTANIRLNVLEPNLEFELSKPPLYDAYGFETQNLDGTYYLQDPVHVVHHPVFKWKDDRGGTIKFKVYRHWCPDDGKCSDYEKRTQLPIAKTFDCTSDRCNEAFSITGLTDTIWSLGNGDGQTAYSATDSSWLGLHGLQYRIEVYNIEYTEERILNATEGHTTAKAVVFDPVFESTTYPVLADDEKYGHENRFALASWYGGSWGGGKDDANMTEPYEYRRARMDAAYGALAGYNPANRTTLSWNLTWSEAPRTPAHVLQEYGAPDYPDVSFHSTSHPLRPGLVPLSEDGAAMWPKTGYGRIFFDFPDISQYRLGEPGSRYANATAYVYTMARDFASEPYRTTASGVYTYPDTLFHQRVTIRSVDSEGNIKPLGISLASEPRLDLGAIPLADYIHEKVLHDTGDAGFADLAVHDTYPMGLDIQAETGYIDAKVRRTASLFTTFSHDAHQGDEAPGGPGPLLPPVLSLPGINETSTLFGPVISPGVTGPNPTETGLSGLFGFLSQVVGITETMSDVLPDEIDRIVPEGFKPDGNATALPRPDIKALMAFQNMSRELGYAGLAEVTEGTYMAYPDTSRMNFPLSYGLTMPSPLNVTLGTDFYSQNIDHRLGVTEGGLNITINTDKDNVLLAERTGDVLSISYDENFGAMLGVVIDGSNHGKPAGSIGACAWGCDIYVGWGSLDVTAYNKWGGEAKYFAEELEEPPPAAIPDTTYDEWLWVLALVAFGILAYRLVHNRLANGIWSIRA